MVVYRWSDRCSLAFKLWLSAAAMMTIIFPLSLAAVGSALIGYEAVELVWILPWLFSLCPASTWSAFVGQDGVFFWAGLIVAAFAIPAPSLAIGAYFWAGPITDREASVSTYRVVGTMLFGWLIANAAGLLWMGLFARYYGQICVE